MTPRNILLLGIRPGLILLPARMASPEAEALLLAIAGQESDWCHRVQQNGPALGFWQFEDNGVFAVQNDPDTGVLLTGILDELNLPTETAAIHAALQYNDVLAAVVARLLLWSDPAPLPALGMTSAAYGYYDRNWRPGAPDETRWGSVYATAHTIVTGT